MAMIFLINTICIKIDSICCSTIIVGNLVPTDRLYLSICCSTLIVGNLVVWWVRKIDYIGWKSCDIKVLNPLLLCFFSYTISTDIVIIINTMCIEINRSPSVKEREGDLPFHCDLAIKTLNCICNSCNVFFYFFLFLVWKRVQYFSPNKIL